MTSRGIPDRLRFQNGASSNAVADVAFRPLGVSLVSPANGDISESEATVQTAAPTPMVKGKTTLDKTKVVRFIDTPVEVDCASERSSDACEVLNVSEAQILGANVHTITGPLPLRHQLQHTASPKNVPVRTAQN